VREAGRNGDSPRRLASPSPIIAKLERIAIPDMPITTAVRVLAALEIPFRLDLPAPLVHRVTRDAAHARCIAHVLGRLERAGSSW
jgi:hypothetical protein